MLKRIIFRNILLVICLFFTFSIINANAEENVKEIDIATSPQNVFFEIINSKPGDSFTKVLQIQNKGSKDFKYLFSNRFLNGSEKFYNELILTVSDNNGEVYKGKIKDFNKLDSRKLKRNTQEDMIISIYIPYELGNEFQSLNSEFQFKFFVEGTLGGVLPADGPKLPNTSTDMFNILVVGSILILTGSTIQFFIRRRNKLDNQV
ncbi:cell wall protein [Neobacillus vireti]|uniref:cell wall protein n=1 Tax=Neobacillus vireti TaxID=220686 RepID=UPI002FFF70F4